jgi:hypothetical protein
MEMLGRRKTYIEEESPEVLEVGQNDLSMRPSCEVGRAWQMPSQ